ncbi:MAG: tetratricopeptide repeat protein [Alphaproteobacteria bacterium]|nr:tetratricopeptide repeat protein [Alphaproteobacteria bacterium]
MSQQFMSMLRKAQQELAAERILEAAGTARHLVEGFPAMADSWIVAGLVARRQGRDADAEQAFRTAANRAPKHPEPWRQLGILYQVAGRLREAEAAYAQGLRAAPQDAALNNNLGTTLRALGRSKDAEQALRNAVRKRADYAMAWQNLGNCLAEQGRHDDAMEGWEKAWTLDPSLADSGLALARTLLNNRKFDKAEAVYRKILARDPDNALAQRGLRWLRRRNVPVWHFPMMNDTPRNEAYRAAIRRAAQRGGRLLDIGTGSGLLSMMAAEAGFQEIHTCEMVPEVAEAARAVIAANGLSDRINVIAKKSTDVKVGKDIPGPADVLVTETFDSALLGEYILPTMDHARHALLAPGAQVIPRGGSLKAALISGEVLRQQFYAGRSMGFDLSAFNQFSPLGVSLVLDCYPHEMVSAEQEVFRFDLMTPHPADKRALRLKADRDATVIGVAVWLSLDLDDETTFENKPGATGLASGWHHGVSFFLEPREMKSGDTVEIIASHDRVAVEIVVT